MDYFNKFGSIILFLLPLLRADGGCRSGNCVKIDLNNRICGCGGMWKGHVSHASHLCDEGWAVCSWRHASLLKRITWQRSLSTPGCYAYDAAQDGGRCMPCNQTNLLQDDMAGVGGDCPHQVKESSSCTSGGQVGVGCCVESHFNRACQYRHAITTGVLCCKKSGTAPKLIIEPVKYTHLKIGDLYILSCTASGRPKPKIKWLHNGMRLYNDKSRASISQAGYLIIVDVRLNDSGLYNCIASNRVTTIVSKAAKLLVTEYASACADGTTEALGDYEMVQGCGGSWKGHVKRGRLLCARGFEVCSNFHSHLLKLLTWHDVTSADGCFAYNASPTETSSCSKCVNGPMAGVGRSCAFENISNKSCLTEGSILVHLFNEHQQISEQQLSQLNKNLLELSHPAKNIKQPSQMIEYQNQLSLPIKNDQHHYQILYRQNNNIAEFNKPLHSYEIKYFKNISSNEDNLVNNINNNIPKVPQQISQFNPLLNPYQDLDWLNDYEVDNLVPSIKINHQNVNDNKHKNINTKFKIGITERAKINSEVMSRRDQQEYISNEVKNKPSVNNKIFASKKKKVPTATLR